MKKLLLTVLVGIVNYPVLGASGQLDSGQSKRGVTWGVYEMLTRRYSWEDRLDQAEADFGVKPQFVLFFRDLNPNRAFPAETVETAHTRGMTPVISLEISQWGRGGDQGHLKEVAAGDFDGFFKQWALDAKDCGKSVILRFGFEMNGDWFPWGSQPATFVTAWRRIHTLFKSVGCDNVQWMFSPNVLWDKRTAETDLYNYYPGDAYVDKVGLDGYNFGDNHDKWHKWQSYEEVFEKTIRACQKFRKPLYLSEIGCADDPRKAAWMRDFLEKVSKDDRLEGFIYFNHFNPRKGEPNWRVDSDPATLRIFREWTKTNETAGK